MPSFEEKTILIQKNKLKQKFNSLKKDTEDVISSLQNCLYIFGLRFEEVINSSASSFNSLYRKLNDDFEDFQEKLIYVQASIDIPSGHAHLPIEESNSHELISSSIDIVPDKDPPHIHPVHASENNISTASSSSLTPHQVIEQKDSTLNLDSHHPFNQCDTSETNLSIQNTDCQSLLSASYLSFHDISDSNAPNSEYNTALSTSSSSAASDVASDQKRLLFANVFANFLPQSFTLPGIVQDAAVSLLPEAPGTQSSSCAVAADTLSQGSCHRSVSSSLSECNYLSAAGLQRSLEIQSQNRKQCSSPAIVEQAKREVPSIKIEVPTNMTCILTHIVNPGNFWLQLSCAKASMPSFPKEKYINSAVPSHVKEGDFSLAPSKSMAFYLRAKVLSQVHENMEDVDVFFIDHGSSQTVPLKDLREMPEEAYDIPMQAIHCFLADISAHNNIWCLAAIRKLKEYSNSFIETHIKSQVGDMYGVQLITTALVCGEEYSCDIGQYLCMEGYAVEIQQPKAEESSSTSALCDTGQAASYEITNKISCDSGVFVTSNHQVPSPAGSDTSQALDSIDEGNATEQCFKATGPSNVTETKDLMSFDSVDSVVEESLQEPPFMAHNRCSKTCTCTCPLHLLIPFPSITFVEEGMALVMVSHIVDPSEFYVNMASESSSSLDELLEQMTQAYSSLGSSDERALLLDDLKEGMYCAARFEDSNWYRVKILNVHLKFDESPNVYVQYIDYGNKAWIRNTDLKTLTTEFAETPAFSVKCSLAGVIPVGEEECLMWSDEAVNAFKAMINFENCMTAQTCNKTKILDDDPLQILLWGYEGEQEVLINQAYAEKGYALFDMSLLQSLLHSKSKKSNEIEVLNRWDPMSEEYKNIQNSYGVHMDEFEVAVTGYKNNDESYMCRYYALRGYCPRGVNCTFKHISLAEGGVTRDQEELFSFNSCPLLPEIGSWVLVNICSVLSPSHFYVQLPFGKWSVKEIDEQVVMKGVSKESLQNIEIYSLYEALNKHYTSSPFDENTTVALSYGCIVVALRRCDRTWHRARIIEIQGIDEPAKVFFVDFGNQEWVERKNIRQILPQFLLTPFQAVECCLADVEPLGTEQGRSWSKEAISRFKELVQETVLLAHVMYQCNDILQIRLKRTTENDQRTVSDHLIREGFGQSIAPAKTKKPACRYVPG